MAIIDKDQPLSEEGMIYAPWQRRFSRILTPIEEFISDESASSVLLVAATILALFLANHSAFSQIYQQILQAPLSLTLCSWGISMSLHHWVNDALMAIFFFVVGLELKREILVGELSNIRQASLPVIAALGGMLVPALIYAIFNPSGIEARGWGVPMATDIAFAVGVLILLGDRIPKSLITFLIALAIADDLGAVLVIALFYTDQIAINWLIISALFFGLLITINFSGVRQVAPYFAVAVLLWYAMLQSGVHATLAGVLGALTVPMRAKYKPALFIKRISQQIAEFSHINQNDKTSISNSKPSLNHKSLVINEKLQNIAKSLEDTVIGVQAPLQRLEQFWHVPVAFFIIPAFALFNAGITIKLATFASTLLEPVLIGDSLGLLAGKFIGITGACAIALKFNLGQLPNNVRFSQIAAVSLVAGIGFTMSIFIAELAFENHAQQLLLAKTGVILGSLVSGLLGFCWLWVLGRNVKK